MTPRAVMNFVVAAFAWVVGTAPDESGYESAETICGSCGNRIRADWRLCPHCGELRNEQDAHFAPQG